MDKLKQVLRHLRPEWHAPSALVVATASTLTVTSALLSYLDPAWQWFPALWSICAIGVGAAWYLPRRPPVTRGKQIGIVIALTAEDEATRSTRADLIASLRRNLEESAVRASFDVLEVQEWRAREVVDAASANRLRLACRAHFLLFGSVRRRRVDGDETAIIQLRGMVTHAPLPEIQGKQLKQEFTRVMPSDVFLDPKNEFMASEFTSRWVGVVTQYVIALAAAMSGDMRYAEALLVDVRAALPERDSQFEVFAHIRNQLPKLLAQIYRALVQPLYNDWIMSRDEGRISDLEALLERVERAGCDRQPFLALWAICAFVRERDAAKAMAYLREVADQDNPVVLINLAFLEAYRGNLKRASQLYRRAQGKGLAPQTVVREVETFQDWILQVQPDCYQLYFSLGYLNLHLKGDRDRAADDFREFLQRCPETKYAKERELILQWIPALRAPQPRES